MDVCFDIRQYLYTDTIKSKVCQQWLLTIREAITAIINYCGMAYIKTNIRGDMICVVLEI